MKRIYILLRIFRVALSLSLNSHHVALDLNLKRRYFFSLAPLSVTLVAHPFLTNALQGDTQDLILASIECANGSIISEAAVPGAYQQICMTLPNRKIPLESINQEIVIYQGIVNKEGGSNKEISGRTGTSLWNSGICLARILNEMTKSDPGFFRDKTVLELGTGTGLCSIAASKLGAKYVIATDGNDEVVALAAKNLEVNQVDANKAATQKLLWGALNAVDFYDVADILIGSDLTYNSGAWNALIETMDAVLKPSGICIYLTLGHSGFNVNSEIGGFTTVLNSGSSLEVLPENHPAWPLKVQSLETLLLQCISSKEKEVLQGTGGFRVLVIQKKKKDSF